MIEPPPSTNATFNWIWIKWLSNLYDWTLSPQPGSFKLPNETTTNLADVSHTVNTKNKAEGTVIFNATTNSPVYAVGSAAADVWVDATGSTAHSPV